MHTLAFSTLACPQWSIEQAIQAASDYGYDALEWRLADGELITATLSEQIRDRLVAATRARHLPVITLDTSCRLLYNDEPQRLATLDEATAMLQLAHDLGAPAIRVFGGDPAPHVTMAASMAAAAAMLGAIAERARSFGVRVLVETHDALWSHTSNTRTLLDTANMSNTGIIWDVYHTCRAGESPAGAAQILGATIASVHIKDGRQTADGWQLCLPGEGDIPLGQIFRALHAQNYQGPFCFEWEKLWHPELAAPEVALPMGVRLIRKLIGQHLVPQEQIDPLVGDRDAGTPQQPPQV